MTKWRDYLRDFAPYILIVISLIVSTALYVNAERQRYSGVILMSRAMEIQSRISEIHERLNVLYSVVSEAEQAKTKPNVPPLQLQLIQFNLQHMIVLPYIGDFLTEKDIQSAKEDLGFIGSDLRALLRDNQLDKAAQWLHEALSSVSRMQGNAILRNSALSQAIDIEESARRDRIIAFGAAIVLSLLALYLFTYNNSSKRHEDRIRAFYHMFAHMTRSRVASLNLFIQQLEPGPAPSREVREAAHATAIELATITDRLLAVGVYRDHGPSVPLAKLADMVAAGCTVPLAVEIGPKTGQIPVPASYWHLILTELVANAVDAVQGRPHPLISLRANARASLFGRRTLYIEVADNGLGMSPANLAKALHPFFSTRAGAHAGLRLTSCAEMVKRMRGRMRLASVEGVGTIIRIRCRLGSYLPLHASLQDTANNLGEAHSTTA
jgi:signal transduction histidine kinase